jgi:hypothetical protein
VPVIGSRTTVTTVATQLMLPNNGSISAPVTGSLLNLGPSDVDLGGPGVVAGAGYLLRVGGTFDLDLIHGDVLFGVTASSTAVICKLLLMQ